MSYLKLYRDIVDHWVFSDPRNLKIWVWLLASATYKTRHVNMRAGSGTRVITLNPGDLLYGRLKAEEELQIPSTSVFRALQKFEQDGMITIESDIFGTRITICNWESYQGFSDEVGQATERPRTSHGTPTEHVRNAHGTPTELILESIESIEGKESIQVNPPTPMKPEHPTLPASYNPNGPRPQGWTDADEKKLIMGQEAKQAVKIAQHVHQGGTIEGWRRIEAGCREWKALYQARDHYDRLESPYSRCLDRVKAAFPDDDPIEKLKAITQAYVNDCQKHNRIKLNALNFIDGDRWKDDWSQTETESTANQGLCPDGSTWMRRVDGRYEVTSKSGRKALMSEGWKP